MTKYKITIDGISYEVGVERLEEKTPEAFFGEKDDPKPATSFQQKTDAAGSKTAVKSPMPGTIISIKAAEGDKVHKGQAIVVLEAMKMNNEIAAPCDGTLTAIKTVKGANVQGGDVLFEIN